MSAFAPAIPTINLPRWSELLNVTGRERVLEVNSADGGFLAALAPAVGEVVGLESDAGIAMHAHDHFRHLRVPARMSIGTLHDFDDLAGFDVIVMQRGVADIQPELRASTACKLYDLLRDDGVLFLTDPAATAEDWLAEGIGWHDAIEAAGFTIRREVLKMPVGSDVLAFR